MLLALLPVRTTGGITAEAKIGADTVVGTLALEEAIGLLFILFYFLYFLIILFFLTFSFEGDS
jgi:hypothetical protein